MNFTISSDYDKMVIGFDTDSSQTLNMHIHIMLIFDAVLNCWTCNFKVHRRICWGEPWIKIVEVSTSAGNIPDGVSSALQEVSEKLLNHEIDGSMTEWIVACQLVDDFRRYFATFKMQWQ